MAQVLLFLFLANLLSGVKTKNMYTIYMPDYAPAAVDPLNHWPCRVLKKIGH